MVSILQEYQNTTNLTNSQGTYFGTQDEYNALGLEQRLAANATVSTTTLNNWLGAVTNWAENEALQLIGGVVS